METIKAVCFNAINYCRFPNGITNIRDFIDYINRNYNSFIKLEIFVAKDCVAPYFTLESTETQYWNPAHMRVIQESEVHILTENEYLDKLYTVVSQKCEHCVHYSKDACEMDYTSFRGHINLDGECYGFEKAQQ